MLRSVRNCLRSRQLSQWSLAATLLFAAVVLASRVPGLLPGSLQQVLPGAGSFNLGGLVATSGGSGHTTRASMAGEDCPKCERDCPEVEPPPAPRRILVPTRGANASLFTPDAVNLPPNLLFPELQPKPALHAFLAPDSASIPAPRVCPDRYLLTNPWWYSRHHNNIISMHRALLFAMYLNRTLVLDGGYRLFETTMEIRRMGWCVFSIAEWGEMMLGKRALPGKGNTTESPGVPRKVMCFLWNVEGHGHCNNDFWDWPSGEARPNMMEIRLGHLEVQTHHVHPYRHIARAVQSAIYAAEMDPATADAVGTLNMHFTYFTGVSKFTSREIWMYTRPSLGFRRLVVDMMDCFFGKKAWLQAKPTGSQSDSKVALEAETKAEVKDTSKRLERRAAAKGTKGVETEEEVAPVSKGVAVRRRAAQAVIIPNKKSSTDDAEGDKEVVSSSDNSEAAGAKPEEASENNGTEKELDEPPAKGPSKDVSVPTEAHVEAAAVASSSKQSIDYGAEAEEDTAEEDSTEERTSYTMPNYTYVGIHHRQLEGACYQFGNKYPGSLNKTAMQKVCEE